MRSLFFSDVFVPERGIFSDEFAEHIDTFFRRKIHDFDSIVSEPVDTAAKILGLADYHGADAELPDQTAAIPAGRERRDHNFVAIAFLPAGSAKGVGLAMRGRVAVLHPAIVASGKQFSVRIEEGCADRNAAFGEALASFADRRSQVREILFVGHRADLQKIRYLGFAGHSRGATA